MKRAYLVQGLGFGDEGKGSVVDAIVRRTGATLVARFNGGAQAAHTVVTRTSQHTFSQWGSGTLAGAATYLSRFVMVDPLALAVEAEALRVDPGHRVMVDADAPILTPWHRALNRLRELSRGRDRHGSCGMGIGELASDLHEGRTVIRAGDLMRGLYVTRLAEQVRAEKHLQLLQLRFPEVGAEAGKYYRLMAVTHEQWVERVNFEALPRMAYSYGLPANHDTVVFEGAQGVLLDQTAGFAPHNTWSDCTFRNVGTVLAEAGGLYTVPLIRVGVLRAFATRHGCGPFPTERGVEGHPAVPDSWARGEHNTRGDWQGSFRYGDFDAVLARYALDVIGGVDMLALNCLDRLLPGPWRCADAYGQADGFVEDIGGGHAAADLWRYSPRYVEHADAATGVAAELGRPVGILSRGPHAEEKTFVPELWPEEAHV